MQKFNVVWMKHKKRGHISRQEVTFIRLEDAIWYSNEIEKDPNHTEI